jgi:fructose 1,6-bisphosphate aldolase/phosphatase
MLDDPGFGEARNMTNIIANNLRRHGPFEPHRLPMDEMEYTTLPEVMGRIKGRWQQIPD